MLKKATSGVLAIVSCSRTARTLRAPKWLWPCWMTFLAIPVSYQYQNFLEQMPAIFGKYSTDP